MVIALPEEKKENTCNSADQMIREITDELKASKEEIRKLKDFIISHIENLNDVLFSVDLRGNFTYISPSIYNITGYRPEEVLGKPFMNYIHPEDLEGLIEEIDLTLIGVHHPYMFRVIHKSGKYLYVHTSSRGIVKNGEIVGINGIMVNIERLKQIEFKLKEEKEKAHTYLDIAGVMIIAIDRRNKITLTNKIVCTTLDYDEKELPGKSIFTIIPEKYQHEIAFQFNRGPKFKNGQINFECPILTQNQDEKICSWSCTPIINDGEREGYLLAGEDITRKKLAEEAFLKAKILAEDANRTKSEFLTNMSHELRTPLNSVIGFSEFILSKDCANLTDSQRKHINNIMQSGKKLLSIINSILDLSRIESGDLTLKRTDIMFPELLSSVLKRLEHLVNNKELTIHIEVDPELKPINADRDKLEQCLYQIIDNAIKFTEKNGHIEIVARMINTFMQVTVTDDGIGISVDEQKSIFDPFVQLDSSTTRNYGGTGIGLALVKRYIEIHEGSIEIKSESGKGTCLQIQIPLKTKPPNLFI